MSIDYATARRERPAQKAALTRAVKSGDPVKVLAVCRAAVKAWNRWGAWPDDWHRWNIALGDMRWKSDDPTYPAQLDDL